MLYWLDYFPPTYMRNNPLEEQINAIDDDMVEATLKGDERTLAILQTERSRLMALMGGDL